jgi:hypothetical protein
MPHMILAAYMATGFTVAGVYAAGILHGRRDRYHYTGLALGFVPAAVLTPFQPGWAWRIRRACALRAGFTFQRRHVAPLGADDPGCGSRRG